MLNYIIKKYWKGTFIAIVLFIMGYASEHTFDGAMNIMVCTGMFIWFGRLLYLSSRGNGKKLVSLVTSLINILRLLWYIISLKPLRMWIRRLRYGLFSASPYPYLALYGSIVDTHAMMGKFRYSLSHDKTPVARAALWRLLARGVVEFTDNLKGKPALKVGEWQDVTSAGLDQELERTIYDFMKKSAQEDGIVVPNELKKAIGQFTNIKKGTKPNLKKYETQYKFADLLNTSISLKAYTKEDVKKIYGMKKFLEKLPSSYNNANFKDEKLELHRIWQEYMTYAYLFGVDETVLKRLGMMLQSEQVPLLQLLSKSRKHRNALNDMMSALSKGVPEAEDVAAGIMGRFTFAWHTDEIYDI